MKITLHGLLCYVFVFLFGICEEEEKCDETKWKPSVDYKVFVSLIDADNGPNCAKKHTVEFKKYHCGGDLSSTMSYEYEGCSPITEDNQLTTWFNRIGSGYYTVTIGNDEDELFFYVKEGENLLHTFVVDANAIKSAGSAGKKEIRAEVHIPGFWWILN